MTKLTKHAYAVIRRTEGKCWFDLESVYALPLQALERARSVDAKCGPTWAKVNPIVRVVKIALLEVESVDVLDRAP
jgi:hypothetical protein